VARISFKPFNQEGELVQRGVTSMRAPATREQVIEKVKYTVSRPGIGLIVHVEVINPDGSLASSWDARYGCIVQCDGAGSEDFATARVPAETNIPKPKETEMTDKNAAAADKTKEAKTKTEKAPETPRATRNGVTEPKHGGRMQQAWALLDTLDLSQNLTWDDVAERAAKVGLTVGGVRAEYPNWRKFHGKTGTISAKRKEAKPAKADDKKKETKAA